MNSLIGIKNNWYTKVYNTYMCPSKQLWWWQTALKNCKLLNHNDIAPLISRRQSTVKNI